MHIILTSAKTAIEDSHSVDSYEHAKIVKVTDLDEINSRLSFRVEYGNVIDDEWQAAYPYHRKLRGNDFTITNSVDADGNFINTDYNDVVSAATSTVSGQNGLRLISQEVYNWLLTNHNEDYDGTIYSDGE